MTRRLGLPALLLYSSLAFLQTYPLSRHLGSRVSYEGDPLLNSFILAHTGRTLLREPARFFELPAFVPYHDALAFSEHLLFPSLLAWPLAAVSGNPLFAHNLLVLSFLALSGYCMFLLARRLTGDAAAACVAGALYGGHTFLINEVPRLQIQAQFFFPLGLLALIEHFERPRLRSAAGFAAVALLCGLSNNYYLLYMPLLFGLALPWLLRRCAPGRRGAAFALLGLCLVPLAAVFLPIAWRYAEVAQRFGFTRELPMGIGLEKYLATRPENWLYGETVPGVRLQTQAAHFTGFVPIALAVVAAAGAWRHRERRGLVLLALAGVLVFGLLSLGQDIAVFDRRVGPGPYRLLFALPGFSLVRIPERLALLMMFWLAVLAGLGTRELLGRAGRARGVLAGLLVAAVVVEHLSIPIRTIRLPVGDETPEVYRWLRAQRMQRVAEVPFYGPWLNRLDSLPMYFAIGSSRAIVNGYTGFYPPAYAFLRHKLSSEPGPFFLETLERLGLDHLVVHPHLWDERDRRAWLAFLAGAQDQLRLVRSFPEVAHGGEPAWDHGGEIVYQVRSPGARQAPALPERQPLPRGPRWVVSASRGPEPEAVVDGDPRTEWATGDVSTTGDFLELRFPEDLEFRGVRLLLTYPHTGYPGRLEVSVRHPDGRWRLTYFDRAAADRELLERLLRSGHDAWYAMDFYEPVRGNAVRLRVAQADPTLEMWRVAELQIYR